MLIIFFVPRFIIPYTNNYLFPGASKILFILFANVVHYVFSGGACEISACVISSTSRLALHNFTDLWSSPTTLHPYLHYYCHYTIIVSRVTAISAFREFPSSDLPPVPTHTLHRYTTKNTSLTAHPYLHCRYSCIYIYIITFYPLESLGTWWQHKVIFSSFFPKPFDELTMFFFLFIIPLGCCSFGFVIFLNYDLILFIYFE